MSLSLKKSEEKSFSLSLKHIKKNMKKGKLHVKESPVKKKRKERYNDRGTIYLGHIPHGFYEEEMKKYFSQFGKVTRLRLARSKKTGRSKGYAFIEFEFAEVAKIAAATMNNYLMSKRLLKAEYIQPEKLKKGIFFGKDWTENNYPKLLHRKQMIKAKNKDKTDKQEQKLISKKLKKVDSIKNKLKKLGIEYNLEIADQPVQDIKKGDSDSEDVIPLNETSKIDDFDVDSDEPIMEIDESEDEIDFKTPPNVKKHFKKSTYHENTKSSNKKSNRTLSSLLNSNNTFSKKKREGGIEKRSKKSVKKVSLQENEKIKQMITKMITSDDVKIKNSSDINKKSSTKKFKTK